MNLFKNITIIKKSFFANLIILLAYLEIITHNGLNILFQQLHLNYLISETLSYPNILFIDMFPYIMIPLIICTYTEIKKNDFIINLPDKLTQNIFFDIYFIIGIVLNILFILLHLFVLLLLVPN